MQSSLTSYAAPIEVGQYFPSFNALRTCIDDWSITDKFFFRVPKKDSCRVMYCCRSKKEGCPWMVSASVNKDGAIQVKGFNAEHICVAAPDIGRKTANSQAWLRRVVPIHLWVTKETTPKQIVETCAIHYNETVNYEAARLCKQFLVQDRLTNQLEQFQQIPGYLKLLQSKHPLIYTHLATDVSNSCFQRVFICPHQAQTSFIQCRKFTAVDGTFLKARFVQTLLLCVGIDANGHNVLLAWSVVESESKTSWEYFFWHLKHALPQILQSTMISDRGKGLLAADWVLGGGVARGHCCVHLKENFRKRFPDPSLIPFFWKIAHAKTHLSYTSNIVELRNHNQAAATYLAEVDPKAWVTAFFPGKTYGHKSSNIVESMNSSLCSDRELSILDLLNQIWHDTMKTRYSRLEQALSLEKKQQTHTPFCFAKLLESKRNAGGNTVKMSSRIEGEVQSRGSKSVYLVNLSKESGSCTCGDYQENGIPCQHALQCIYSIHGDPKDYLPDALSIATWKATYLENWRPISLDEIPATESDPSLQTCLAPVKKRVPAGRPQLARMQSGNQKKKSRQPQEAPALWHCRKCGDVGHNSKTCKA